jgi:hypothetical protein
MKIIFEKEQDGSYSAIVQSVKYKGKVRDELLYATLVLGMDDKGDCVQVKWEDEWSKTDHKTFKTLELAKAHVLENYKDHEPVVLGPSWDE